MTPFCTCEAPKPELVEGVRVCANPDCGQQVADPRDRLLMLIAKQQQQLLAKLDRLEGARDEQPDTGEQPAPGLVGPAELGRLLGRSPQWVREHFKELGGTRSGEGPRPRYWFDPALARERFFASQNGARPKPNPRKPKPRRRRSRGATQLLPVRGRAA